MSVTLTDLQAPNFAFELTSSLFPHANVYLARQKTSSSAPTYLAAVVDSVWRDNDDTSKGVKRRFVVGIQTGETRVLALNKLVEELEDVAREWFEKILDEEELDEDEEEEGSEEEEKGQPQVVVGVQEEEMRENNPVEKPMQKSSTAAATPAETPRQTLHEEEVAKNKPVKQPTQKSSTVAATPAETGRQTRASAKAIKTSANNNTTPTPVITTSESKSTVTVPESDSSSLSEVDDLIEAPEPQAEAGADSTDAFKGNWGEREKIVVQPKKAVASQQAVGSGNVVESKKAVASKKQVKPRKGRRKLMVIPEHPFGETTVEDTTKQVEEGSRLRGKGKR
jgi:hypothetical protein